MKKILIILLLGVLLLGSVSAADWDNQLTYSNNDLKVNFTNSILGIIPTTNIGSAELKSHKSVDEIITIEIGKNKTVMWYEFDFREVYENGLGDVQFIDGRTGKEIQKDYYFVELVEGQQANFETVCEERFNPNGTSYTRCSQVQNGFKPGWKKLDLNNIPKGKTIIGLVTDVERGDYIDAIWNIVGKEVSKHAFWIAGESNTRSTTLDPIFSLSNQATNAEYGINITIGYENIFLTKATMMAGVTADTAYVIHNNGTLMDTQAITSENAPFNLMLLGNETYYVLAGDPTDLWTAKREDSLTFPIDMTEVSFISGVQGTSYPYTTDSARAWNIKSLDLAPAINVTVEVTINSPIDNFNTTNPTINFNSTIITDSSDLNNVTLYINDVANETNSSGTEGMYLFTKIFADQTSTWIIEGCNTGGCFNASSRIFTVDTIKPTISIESPLSIYDYLYRDYNLTLNTTVTDVNLDVCWREYNLTNTTFSCSTGVKTNTGFNYEPNFNNITIWANDTIGNQHSNFTSWEIKILENSRIFNTTSYETKTEIFSINITANSSLTAVALDYNGTEYATTKSGTVYSKTLEIPEGVLNRTFRWKTTYAGSSIYSTYSYQNISVTSFSICDGSLTNDFLNISFKDEADLIVINATIPTSTFTYYLGSGTINKTYTYVNNTLNYNYTFCATPTGESFKTIPNVQYKQGTAYPQRVWNPSLQTYTSTSTNQILYLLATAEGIYVTFQVINSADQLLSGVTVTATREIGGSDVQVAGGTTSASGTVTFWLNPDFIHTFNFTKSGYTTYTYSEAPTQSSYTITLSGTTTTVPSDYTQGINLYFYPGARELFNDTSYDFEFNVTSSFWELDSFGFNLRLANGTNVGTVTSTTEGTAASFTYDVGNQTIIYMDYNWVIEGNLTIGTTYWVVSNTLYTGWSVKTFFTDLNTYLDSGIFGLDNFGRYLIIFLVLFLAVGIMSYKFGIVSPVSVLSMMFAIVFFLDVVVGLIPEIRGINYLITYLVGLALMVSIISEVTR